MCYQLNMQKLKPHQKQILEEIELANSWAEKHDYDWIIEEDIEEFIEKLTDNDAQIIMGLIGNAERRGVTPFEYTKEDAEDAAVEAYLEQSRGII